MSVIWFLSTHRFEYSLLLSDIDDHLANLNIEGWSAIICKLTLVRPFDSYG